MASTIGQIGLGGNTWADFKTLVRSLLTDGQRCDEVYTQAVAAFVKSRMEREFNNDLELAASYLQEYVLLRNRLLGYQSALDDAALTTSVNVLITVDADRQGTDAYRTAAIAEARLDLEGVSATVENLIRQGTIDVQSAVDIYKCGQETTLLSGDLTPEGKASKGTLPAMAQLRDAYWVPVDSGTHTIPLNPFPWDQREMLICGKAAINGNHFHLCIDPWGKNFFVYPQVDDKHKIVLTWDGVKVNFQETDVVPFDEPMAGVVAEYVRGCYARDIMGNHALYQSVMRPQVGSYYAGRRRLYLDSQDRTRMKNA